MMIRFVLLLALLFALSEVSVVVARKPGSFETSLRNIFFSHPFSAYDYSY